MGNRIDISNTQRIFLKNLTKMIESSIGHENYLITEQDISDKYNIGIEEVILLEKEAIPYEIDERNIKLRRVKILKNIFDHGLDFYKENKGGLKSDFTDALILNKEGKILMLLRNKEDKIEPNKWGPVGGHLETSLSPERNVKKEIKEETGLTVLECNLIHIKDLKQNKKIYYFVCTLPNYYEIVLNEREHTQYKWMSLEDIKNMSDEEFMFDFRKYLLTKIFKVL